MEIVDKQVEFDVQQWTRGTVRKSVCGQKVILVVGLRGNQENQVVILKYPPESIYEETFLLDSSKKDYWIKECPIVVRDAKLYI